MTEVQSAVTIGAVVLGTMATRFLPFLVFPKGKTPPKFVQYLGKVLPLRRHRSASRLLLQRRRLKRNLRHTGNSVGAVDNRPAQMEEKHAAENRRRHGTLYAARADGVQIIRCATDIFEDRLCRIHRTPRPPLQGESFAYPRRRTRTRRKSRPGGLLPCGTE